MANDAHGKDGGLIITKCLTLDALSIGLYLQEAKVPVCVGLYQPVCDGVCLGTWFSVC